MEDQTPISEPKKEVLSLMEQLACILIPLVGIVLYFIFVSKDEAKAKLAMQLAFFGIVAGVIITLMINVKF